ncbi:hypothetical protein AAZV13_18G130200 [Glycine max]
MLSSLRRVQCDFFLPFGVVFWRTKQREQDTINFSQVLEGRRGKNLQCCFMKYWARSWRGAAPSWHNGGGWWQVLLQMEAPPCDGGVLRWERGRESRRGIVDATAHPGIWTE